MTAKKTESASTLKDLLFSPLAVSCAVDIGILLPCIHKIMPFWNQLSEQAKWMTEANTISAAAFLICAFVFLLVTGRMKKDGSFGAVGTGRIL